MSVVEWLCGRVHQLLLQQSTVGEQKLFTERESPEVSVSPPLPSS